MNVDEMKYVKISEDPEYKNLLRLCYEYAYKSNHPSTHNAALLVEGGKVKAWGINTLPPGVENRKERFEGKNKHIYPNHAERDAIYKAAREGVKTEGLEMVMPWLPCIPCANAIITSGIKRLICHKQMIEKTDEKWVEELEEALELLKEAGVEVVAYDGKVGAKAYMHGEEWDA